MPGTPYLTGLPTDLQAYQRLPTPTKIQRTTNRLCTELLVDWNYAWNTMPGTPYGLTNELTSLPTDLLDYQSLPVTACNCYALMLTNM